MTSSQRLYVYGVIPADAPAPDLAERVEPSDGPIDKVAHHEVAALVSAFSATRVRPTRANLRAHEGVVEQATRLGMVIPMRFGVLVDNEDELVSQFLRPRLQELRDLLRTYDAHTEMRVEARYRDGVAVREAAADEPRIARLRRRMQGRPPAA